MTPLLVVLASYALGCIVGAYYLVRLRTGADVRATGSGNAGARNVFRSGDRLSAALTLIWDAAKGALAIWIARTVAQDWVAGAAFIAVIAGHIWPAQLHFRGGKGAATALGCMLLIEPRAAIMAIAAGVFVGGITRSATVGGLTAIAAAPLLLAMLNASWALSAAAAVACTVVLLVHHPAFDRRRQAPATMPARENTV